MAAKKLPAPKHVPPVRKVPTGPLSVGMRNVVVSMLREQHDDDGYGMTGNEIGLACGFSQGMVHASKGWHGNASMGPAQKIIPCLIGLERRGLIAMAARRDKRSGTAYRLTPAGFEIAIQLREETKLSDTRTDAATADGGDRAVWVLAETVKAENLDPIAAGDIMYLPGVTVLFDDEHEVYPGEEGVVQAVGKGKGLYDGSTVYDVLVEGTSEAERVFESYLEAA